MPDENKEALIIINQSIKEAVNQKSAMAGRLTAVFKRCKEVKDDDDKILVPQDVRERMKELCSETEKILKDMPNKKFKLKTKLNLSGALNSLKKANECIDKASVNKSSFNKLVAFYGEKNEILKYKTKMDKYCADLNKIISNIKGAATKKKNNELFTENNSRIELIEKINEKAEIHDEDQKLINLGHICIDNKDSNYGTYKEYIQAFFDKYTESKVNINNKKMTLVEAFKDISIALRELKVIVAKNEKMVVGDGGINISRNVIHDQMKEIKKSLNYFMRKANHCVNFLEGLPMTGDKLVKAREKNVKKIKDKIAKCDEFINVVNDSKASVLYGETTFYSNDIPYLAIGKNYKGTFFSADKMRISCNTFTESLDDIVSFICGGKDVYLVSKSMSNLESKYENLVKNMSSFCKEVSNFNGYFNEGVAEDKETLRRVSANYNKIYEKLRKVAAIAEDTRKLDTKLDNMEKKMKDELEEYNKTSSKVKRGVKRVFGVMGTIARYTLNVTEFLKNVLFISSSWPGLAQSLTKNDQTAAQVQYVPVPVTVNSN